MPLGSTSPILVGHIATSIRKEKERAQGQHADLGKPGPGRCLDKLCLKMINKNRCPKIGVPKSSQIKAFSIENGDLGIPFEQPPREFPNQTGGRMSSPLSEPITEGFGPLWFVLLNC